MSDAWQGRLGNRTLRSVNQGIHTITKTFEVTTGALSETAFWDTTTLNADLSVQCKGKNSSSTLHSAASCTCMFTYLDTGKDEGLSSQGPTHWVLAL